MPRADQAMGRLTNVSTITCFGLVMERGIFGDVFARHLWVESYTTGRRIA